MKLQMTCHTNALNFILYELIEFIVLYVDYIIPTSSMPSVPKHTDDIHNTNKKQLEVPSN